MIISSRTPEGEPNRCPVCGAEIRIDPSKPAGDAPCPNCGHLIWFPQSAVTVASDFDATDIDTLLRLDTESVPARLLLNFQGVSFMSSSMITKLVLLNKAVKERRGKLTFCNVCPNVHEVLKITKLDKLFDIAEDEASALKRFEE